MAGNYKKHLNSRPISKVTIGSRLPGFLSDSKLRLLIVFTFAILGTILIFISHANPVRNPFDQPYLSSSFWNTPLGTGAQYDDEKCNAEFHRGSPSYPAGTAQLSAGAGIAWDGSGKPYYSGLDSDPVYKVFIGTPPVPTIPGNYRFDPNYLQTGSYHPFTYNGQEILVHVPANARTSYFSGLAGDTQGNENRAPLVDGDDSAAERQYKRLVQAQTRDHGVEFFMNGTSSVYVEGFRALIDRETHTVFLVTGGGFVNDAAGAGGAGGGTRAAHTSEFAGKLRGWEMFDRGNIQHAVAFGLSRSFSKAPPVWPAVGGETDYTGQIPFGSLLALPPSVDINSLGLSSDGLVLARAMQQYGGYTVDSTTAPSPTNPLYKDHPELDPGNKNGLNIYADFLVDQTNAAKWARAVALNGDWKKIAAHLKCVSNNNQTHPGGPGARVTTNIAPPLAGENGINPPPDQPPSISLTAPAANTQLTGTAALAASASDDNGVTKVEFYSGTTKIGEDTAAPYSYSWDTTTVARGAASLTAKAYDTAGQSTSSAPITVFVTNIGPPDQPPTTAITAPTAGSTASATITVTATATDNVGVTKVEFYVDNDLTATDLAAPYVFSWNTIGLANGSHSLTTKAYDTASNVTTSTPVSVIVSNIVTGDNPGDIDGDHVVNIFDLRIIGKNWGLSGRTRAQGDLNGDGTVNIFDLRLIGKNWSS